MMNKTIGMLCFVLLPASALLAQGPRGGGPGGPMGRGPGMMGGAPAVVTGAPYSALEVVQSQETLSDGNVIQRKRQTNVYRDSQGRVRTEETITPDASTGKQPYTVTTILDYVGGHRYVLNSSTMTAMESPLRVPHNPPGQRGGGAGASSSAAGAPNGASPMAVRRGGGPGGPPDQNRPNLVRTTLPTQAVNGVLAAGEQHVETIPVGAIGNARTIQTTRTMWVSNDLKVPVQIKSTDPRFGTTDMELTNIIPAEPNATLFVVPAGYTVKQGGPGQFGGARGPGGPGGARGQGMRGPRPPAPPQQ
jgi:hypothetical protein